MKKTAYATVLVLALLFSAEAQVVMVLANPRFPSPWGYPEITITAPAISSPQNDVWLNLTITKPSNWTDYYQGYLTYVYYLIDGSRERLIAATLLLGNHLVSHCECIRGRILALSLLYVWSLSILQLEHC